MSLGRSSSFKNDDDRKSQYYNDAETLYSMRTPVLSSEINDARDDATENTDKDPASEDTESRTGDDSESLGFSFSVSSGGLTSKDSEVDIESKTSTSGGGDLEESTASLQIDSKAQGGKPPLPPKGARRSLSNTNGFQNILKKSIPFLTRARSNPTKPEDNDDTLSVAKATLIQKVSVDVDGDSVEAAESTSLASVKDANMKASEVEDISIASSTKEDASVATSAKGDLSVANSTRGDISVGTSAKEDVSVATTAKGDLSVATSAKEDTSVATSAKGDASVATSAKGDVSVATSTKGDVSVATSAKEDTSVATSAKGDASVATSAKGDVSVATSTKGDVSVATSVKGDVSVADSAKGDISVTNSAKGDVSVATTAKGDISVATSVKGDLSVANSTRGDISVATSAKEDVSVANSTKGDISVATSAKEDASVATSAKGDISVAASTKGDISVTNSAKGDTSIALPPKGARRSLSNTNGFQKMLKKSIPFLTRTRSNPTKPEDNDDTLSVAKATLIQKVSVDGNGDSVKAAESASFASVKSTSMKASEVEDISIAPSAKEDISVAISAKEDASVATSAKGDLSVATSTRDNNTKASEVEDDTIGSVIASRDGSTKASDADDAEQEAPEAKQDETIDSTVKTVDSSVSEMGHSAAASKAEDGNSETPTKAEEVGSLFGIVKDVSSVSGSDASLGFSLQDPWPNPWSDVGSPNSLAGAPMGAISPQMVNPAKVPEAVIEKIIAASSSVDKLSNSPDCIGEDASVSNSCANGQQVIMQSSSDQVGSPQVSKEEIERSLSLENGSFVKAEAVGMEGLKDVVNAESVEASMSEAPAKVTEVESKASEAKQVTEVEKSKAKQVTNVVKKNASKAKRKKLSPFWKRSKQTRKSKESNTEGSKTSKAKTFKLSFLWLLSPCASKKLSAVKERDEAPAQTPAQERGLDSDKQPRPVSIASFSAEQIESESISPEDSMDGHSSPGRLLAMIEIIDDHLDNLVEDQASVSNFQTLSDGPTDLEETKQDLTPLDTAATSKHMSRSWLTDLPSQETFTDAHKTVSYMSSFGDMSKATDTEAAPPSQMMSNLNSYFSAATQAVQRNLYDTPVRELEKLRDFTCGGTAKEELSKGVATVESHDSLAYGRAPEISHASNPLAVAFNELVEVLELGPRRGQTQSSLTKKNKFEEEKLEMTASANMDASRGGTNRVF